MSRLLIAALFAGVLCAQTTVTWTLTTRDLAWPKNTSWDVPQYDPISGKILFRGNPTSSTAIYSSMQYVYDVAARTFTAGSNPQGQAIPHNQCPANVDTLPTARHGYGQFAVDQGGSRAWFFGGLNQSCPVGINVNASGTTVTIPSGLSIFYTGAVGSWAGLTVTVDGISRTVASVTDTKNLELTEDLGTLTGVTFTYPPVCRANRRWMHCRERMGEGRAGGWARQYERRAAWGVQRQLRGVGIGRAVLNRWELERQASCHRHHGGRIRPLYRVGGQQRDQSYADGQPRHAYGRDCQILSTAQRHAQPNHRLRLASQQGDSVRWAEFRYGQLQRDMVLSHPRATLGTTLSNWMLSAATASRHRWR